MASIRAPKIERLVALAREQVGNREVPKGSNRGPLVDQYTGRRAEPWCGHFVAWCFRSVDWTIPTDSEPSPSSANPLAGVAYMLGIFKSHDWLYMQPQVGDVVFYGSRGKSDVGPGMHCGIVIAVNGDSIETVEGNWSDAVSHRHIPVYSNTNPKIVGFGRLP